MLYAKGHTFLTLPSTFLIDERALALTNIMSAAPTSCPLRSRTYSSTLCRRACSFNVRETAASHSCRRIGSVDIICCGLSSTNSWKPTATMSAPSCKKLVSGHNHGDKSSFVPLPFPFRLNVPAQMAMVFVDKYSPSLVQLSVSCVE